MFAFIIFLMSLSLAGIVTVQIYWIGKAIGVREQQFSKDVNFALTKTSEMLYKRDFVNFTAQFMDFFKMRKSAKQADFTKFVYEQINTSTNESFRFSSSGVYETSYFKGFGNFYTQDSILVATLNDKSEVFKIKKSTNNQELSKIDFAQRFTFFNQLTEIEKLGLENAYHNKGTPISQRVSKTVVEEVLERELKNLGILLDFQYAVVTGDQPSEIRTASFDIVEGKTYNTLLFPKDNALETNSLFVTFPEKEAYLISEIKPMLLLSVFFTLIITLAFVSSLYQMLRQRRISVVKTDFINNMTHEFKTPIATINLALDAIKNPKIHADASKVLKYVGVIKEENKRMHAQVENVLRISKLEKKQFEMPTTPLEITTVVQNAISHVALLLKSEKGSLQLHHSDASLTIQGNMTHLTNVFVNILENAIKYAKDSPKIDIFIRDADNQVVVDVKDCGIGMSKKAQKQVFDKFYRAEVGNVHTVKGHGLGLSYVKEIVQLHRGSVFVTSEKGIGSTFTVCLPRATSKKMA